MFIYVLKTIGVVSAWFTKTLRIHISIITRRTKKTLTWRKTFFFFLRMWSEYSVQLSQQAAILVIPFSLFVFIFQYWWSLLYSVLFFCRDLDINLSGSHEDEESDEGKDKEEGENGSWSEEGVFCGDLVSLSHCWPTLTHRALATSVSTTMRLKNQKSVRSLRFLYYLVETKFKQFLSPRIRLYLTREQTYQVPVLT